MKHEFSRQGDAKIIEHILQSAINEGIDTLDLSHHSLDQYKTKIKESLKSFRQFENRNIAAYGKGEIRREYFRSLAPTLEVENLKRYTCGYGFKCPVNSTNPLYQQDKQFKFGYCKDCDEDSKQIESYFHQECLDSFHLDHGLYHQVEKMIDMEGLEEMRKNEDIKGNFNFRVGAGSGTLQLLVGSFLFFRFHRIQQPIQKLKI